MKKVLKICLVALLSLVSIQPVSTLASERSTQCTKHACEYKAEYQRIYDTMKDKMTKAPITGDATTDFLYEMMPHHEAAVQMSENILKYGENKQVRRIAKNIIKEQNKGIAKMKQLLERVKCEQPQNNDSEYIKNYETILNTMLSKMAEPVESCNPDVIFLQDMIPHHEGAIAMAENILKYTQNTELKEIATQIVSTQKSQLPEMQKLLKELTK